MTESEFVKVNVKQVTVFLSVFHSEISAYSVKFSGKAEILS